MRPTSGPTGGKRGSPLGGRHKRKPPRGMYINHDDLAAMASGGAGVLMLKAMDRELDALQRQVSIKMKERKLCVGRLFVCFCCLLYTCVDLVALLFV